MSSKYAKALCTLALAIMGVYTYMCYKRIFLDPVPMAAVKASPVLLCALAARIGTRKSRFTTMLSLGLVLSAAGDVFLEFDDNIRMPKNELWFIAGLGSFLIAHLFYIAAFWSTRGPWNLPRALPFALYGAAILYVLLPSVEDKLRVPVLVYGSVIALMGVAAAQRVGSPLCTRQSAMLALFGAMSFIASDSALAINRFRRPLPYAKVIVIVTYYLAQLLITLSARGGSLPSKAKPT